MVVKYYKKWLEAENRYQYEERNGSVDDDCMMEISQEEYETETAKQWNEYLASLPVEETITDPAYDELLAEKEALEKENASLLFQLLTGEEYTDV